MLNVQVAVRIRPFSQRETIQKDDFVVHKKEGAVIVTTPKIHQKRDGSDRRRTHRFLVDFCFDSENPENSSQEAVYKEIGIEIIRSMFEGYNACVLAYGHSASGKTYTMMGTQKNPGLTPRICHGLFDTINFDSKLKFQISISFLEIYNEKVRDLLNVNEEGGSGNFSLRVREHPKLGPYVQGLSQHVVTEKYRLLELLNFGNSRRITAATENHDHSSRSHAVFTLRFRQTDCENYGIDKSSKVHLVDLAGSERATDSRSKERLKEGANINKSLVTLGNVISALAESYGGTLSGKEKTWHPFVPYRDSVLTWLLKDTLGGNSRTVMIATVSPASSSFNETLNTLRYAKRTKKIVNHPVINEDPKNRIIRKLREEIIRLKSMLVTEAGNDLSNKENDFERQRNFSDNESNENNSSKNFKAMSLKKNVFKEKFFKNRIDWRSSIRAIEEKTPKMADEKETGVNGSVIDSLHDALNSPDSLESLTPPLLNVETALQDDHVDSTNKTVMKNSNLGMKRILQPLQAQKSNRGRDIVSTEKKNQRPCKQNGSERAEQRLPLTKAVCKSRQDLTRAVVPQVKDSKHSMSSQSHSDVSTLSQSNSENSLNPPGSIDIPPLHNSKSDIQRKCKKKDIVDAVISRLYVSQVNSNIRRVSLQATTTKDNKKENESDGSNVCRKAKKKIFNTSLHKPATAKRIRKLVNGSTQTDFLNKTVRVKEQSVITEMKGNLFVQQSTASGSECEPTNESKIRSSKQSKNDFVSSDSFGSREVSCRKDWSQKLVTNNFSLEPLPQKNNKEMFSDDSLDAEKSSLNEKNSKSSRRGGEKLYESEIINSPENINIRSQVGRENGRFVDVLLESSETLEEIQENNYEQPKKGFDSQINDDYTLLTSKEKSHGSEEDLLSVSEGSDIDETISIRTRKIQIESDDVGIQSSTMNERELYTIKECGECNEPKESKFACGQFKKKTHKFINEKLNTRQLLELGVHKKRSRQNNCGMSLANSEASRVIEHDGERKQPMTNLPLVELSNCVEKSWHSREGIENGNSVVVPQSMNSKHVFNLTYDETEKSRPRIWDSNKDSNLPPDEAGMKLQNSNNSTAGKKPEMKTGTEPRVRTDEVFNLSEYSSLRFEVGSFEMASKRGRSAENLFGSEDSITLVFLRPQTPEFSVLAEVIKRGLGEEIECDPGRKNTTVRETRKMRRSLSVDTALIALSRIAKQSPIGSETKTTSLWNLRKREKCPADEMPELRDNGCQCDLDSKNLNKKLRYSTSTTVFNDKQTNTANLNIPLKKNCRRQTKEKGIQCVNTNGTNYVVRNSSNEKSKNSYSRKQRKGVQPLRKSRMISDSVTRRVRFSQVQKPSSDKKEKSNSQNGSSSLAISNFIKEAMNLLKTMSDFVGDADESKKSKWLKGMAKSRNRKEFCFGNREKFVSPSSSDFVASGLDEDSEISSRSRRPTTKCSKETSYFWTNEFYSTRQCQCLIHSESTNRPIFSGTTKKPRLGRGRIRCGFRLYGSNNPRNFNEFSRSPVLYNSFRQSIKNDDPVSKLSSRAQKCKLCLESTTESVHQWKSSSRIRGTMKPSGRSISSDDTNSKHNMSKKNEEKLVRRRVGGCVGECNCRNKCEKPDPYTWLKSVRSSFELNTLNPGSKHCVSFCTFCRGTGLELYCSSPSLNSECPAGRCRLPFYGHCPCSGAKLRNVSPSPRAYMLHLLTLRRRAVEDSAFSIL